MRWSQGITVIFYIETFILEKWMMKSFSLRLTLTHFKSTFHSYTPLKTWENFRFSDVFRGYSSGTSVWNRLSIPWGKNIGSAASRRFLGICVSWKHFCFYVFLDYISFSFYVIYNGKSVTRIPMLEPRIFSYHVAKPQKLFYRSQFEDRVFSKNSYRA